MIINAKKRLTSASIRSYFIPSYDRNGPWINKERMISILEELEAGNEGDSMTTVEGGIVLGSTCFATKTHTGWTITYMDKRNKESYSITATSEFVKNCAKYLK